MKSAVKAKNEVSRYVQTDSQKQLHAPEDSMQLHLYREIDKLQNELGSLKNKLEQMEKAREALPKIVFSASLRTTGPENTGPFNTDTTLVFRRIITNLGNCYNPASGIFTALVRGIYYFTGTVFHEVNVNTAVRLMKNNETIVTLWETYGHTGHGSVSNSAILQLEIGDNVYLQLAANTYIFDNHNHHSTFHGFLLFPN
ncbi:complement C1q-like protein 2 [Lepisosteus oculatus]|uniref:complement C1q-like protein 2 n=1 Tax=Lepisosteus oculatus TaxID=7918 RepID=UPI0035F52128